MYLFFDTETSNLPNPKLPLNHPDQGRIVQLGYLVQDKDFNTIEEYQSLIYPSGWRMSPAAQARHHISYEDCVAKGIAIKIVIDKMQERYKDCEYVVGHNVDFDIKILDTELSLLGMKRYAHPKVSCTMKSTTPICKLPPRWRGTEYKWPKLEEAHVKLFGQPIVGAHDAMNDVKATARIFKWLVNNNKLLSESLLIH